ncbi:hypothetical protein M947_06880 [Sulfurimonas hongkongensis]|uniref:SHOCT domain-containing protein n=1 Tax=Sulfurimonas hongkongensis TaxID=1172190 RepID=T0JRA5_9BACT|nr:flagellar biosynthesis protein FlhA [Sulfurimonas hongkongensis]EQB39377.1 hypothetical protein M947_06880 [Sulfurimonas hongkongensis]
MQDQNIIFIQAILFLSLFGVMFFISYFITRRGAKKFEDKHSLDERKEAVKKRELVDTFLNSSIVKIIGKDETLKELSNKLNKGAINKEEYNILKDTLQAS